MGKIKLFLESEKGKDLIIVIILVLSNLGAFLLGRLSNSESSEGIKIEYNGNQAINTSNITNDAQEGLIQARGSELQTEPKAKSGYFGSSRGTKYYPVDCSAGDKIKKENRIYFDTTTAAENAGYTLSASCD